MTNSFQLIALPSEQFTPLFNQSDAELQSGGSCRVVVDEKPGFQSGLSCDVERNIAADTLIP